MTVNRLIPNYPSEPEQTSCYVILHTVKTQRDEMPTKAHI